MQTEQHIKRLLRELDLPEQADQVIQRPKYWSPSFCWLYFERCDELIFDDARAGLAVAEVAPELVALVERFSRDARSSLRLRVRALAVLGSAYRAVGDLRQSEETYREALRVAERATVPEVDLANVLFRVGMLRSVQGRIDRALSLATRSVNIYRKADPAIRQRHLGEALTMRGLFYQRADDYTAAVKDWSEALSCTDPKTMPRIHYCASHNLAMTLVEKAVDPRSLSTVESYLTRARKFLSKKPRSIQKLRVIWLQGIIMIRFGATRRGEASLVSARRGFIEMEAPFDMALVSLDLGRYLDQTRQFSELRSLADETERIFRLHCDDEQAHLALRVWKDAVVARSVSSEANLTAWEILQQLAARSCLDIRASVETRS